MEGMKENAPELYEMATCLYNAMDKPKDVIYYNAPVIVFVIGPEAGGAVSCALACENMMIAATSFGLGSCYTGFGAFVKSNNEVVNTLELKENKTFAQQAADIARTTVPAANKGPDPALVKIEQDRAKATPMPAHIRQQINSVLRKV